MLLLKILSLHADKTAFALEKIPLRGSCQGSTLQNAEQLNKDLLHPSPSNQLAQKSINGILTEIQGVLYANIGGIQIEKEVSKNM